MANSGYNTYKRVVTLLITGQGPHMVGKNCQIIHQRLYGFWYSLAPYSIGTCIISSPFALQYHWSPSIYGPLKNRLRNMGWISWVERVRNIKQNAWHVGWRLPFHVLVVVVVVVVVMIGCFVAGLYTTNNSLTVREHKLPLIDLKTYDISFWDASLDEKKNSLLSLEAN